MNELTRTEKWLEKAFELAYFIHGDVETAKHIAFNAMNKLEVASNAQYKRFYYSPEARNSRSKVSMNDLQLLQRLVYVESESFEKEKEFTETVTEKDLLIYFIKHLIRITLKRNSFYVTLGMSRILHNYATTQAMEIYNVVVQDPEKVHDDYYYRSRKGILMKELKNRFGEKLEITNANRGEQRFQACGYSEVEAELVNKCLKSFTPWNTACELPEKFNPHFETIKSLCFTGNNADDEHRIELNRMHVLLNPETFQKVVNSLSFPLPQEKLELPKFNMKRNKQNSDQNDDRQDPPSLEDADLKELKAMLEQESARRKSASSGFLRVVVDGEEKVVFDSAQQKFERFEIDREFSELVEVYSVENGRDVLLATYLMGGDDDFAPNSVLLEKGQKISFSFDKEICSVSYEETNWQRKLKNYWHKSVLGNFNPTKILRPVMVAFGLLLACLAGISLFQNPTSETFQVAQNGENPNFEVPQFRQIKTENPNVSVTNHNQAPKLTTNRINKIEIATKPLPSKLNKQKTIEIKNAPDSTEIAENIEVKKFPIVERREDTENEATRSVTEVGKPLKNVKFIFVEVTGDDKYGRQLGEQLMDKINANKRFLAVNNRDKADGLLKVSVRRESDNGKDENTIVSAVVRLVNSDGFVIFPNKKKVSAWRYVGNATKIPTQVVKDLTKQ
ncbi:MAG TPA: hypothetical protein PKY82_17375 [Pyrinomonadaceae bacterium]|nr:hypothetical protein [Pyrinomonadaceae bacterium]